MHANLWLLFSAFILQIGKLHADKVSSKWQIGGSVIQKLFFTGYEFVSYFEKQLLYRETGLKYMV